MSSDHRVSVAETEETNIWDDVPGRTAVDCALMGTAVVIARFDRNHMCVHDFSITLLCKSCHSS